MALATVPGGGRSGRIFHTTTTTTTATTITTVPIRHLLFPLTPRRTLHIASAKKLSSRTGKFDSKNRRSTATTTTTTTKDQEDGEDYGQGQGTAEVERVGPESSAIGSSGVADDDGYFLPELPGDKPDFWEGPQWDALGFFVQYLWAFGIGFALIACGIAVMTYNEGATDFKDTPAYKESVQSWEFLEEPDANSDVFESNPTELIACGIAVMTYNEGATDFKDTPAYKESVQSWEFLEEPDANSDVFESNPTEVAPSLE